MSHRAFAALWLQLENRIDIDNIVCELIGRHNLESCSLAANSEQLQHASCGLAIFLRVVFDLQRTYLQCPRPALHAARFLRPSKLLSAVIYLFRVKAAIFASVAGNPEQYENKRSFVVQALVSGLRALWLWRHPFSKDEMNPLRTFCGEWNESGDLDTFHKRLCSSVINEIADLEELPSDLSFPACRVVNLQDYSTGLNPLETRDNDLIKSAKKASLCLHLDKQEEWFKNYWILFDIAWTTEAALIQLYMPLSKSSNGDSAAHQNQNINRLYATRKAVLDIISTSKTVESVIRSSLNAILFVSCWGRICDCLDRLKAPLSNPNDSSTILSSMAFDKIGKPSDEMTDFVTKVLDHHQKVLGIRKENLRDCNGDLAELSESLDRYLDDWYSDKVKLSTFRLDRRSAYIIYCPELHQIPYQMLKNLIEGSSGKVGLEELERKSTLFDVDITCDQCDSEHPVTKARQIDPLGRLSAMMCQKLDRKPSLESDVKLLHDVGDLQRSSGTSVNSTPSVNRSLSNRVSSSDMGSPISGDLNLFFDEPPKKSHKLAQPFYAFSSDGQSLLLWKKLALHLASYDIISEEVTKFDATNVVLAAAGANVYAVISRQGNGQTLFIYRRVGDPIVGKTEKIPLVYSIAVSSNDKFVAVGFHKEIWIYVVETQQILTHKLVSVVGKDIDCQLISFSANCEEFIIATRYEDGNVYTSVSRCLKPSDGLQLLPKCKIDRNRHNDFGLSSVLYHSNSTHACIAAFTYSKPPVLLPTPGSGGSAWPIPEIGTQIQCAAISPLGGKFILVNYLNHIYRVEQLVDGANGAWTTEKLKMKVDRKMVSSRGGLMAIAVPDEDTVRLFWIEGSRWVLMTIPW